MQLPGAPSDDVAAVLSAGRGDVTTLFVSMATRHPAGLDAEYLQWHTLDHRPEQHRLTSVRASVRLVSTPSCRSARLPGNPRFDAVDHVMTYFFSTPEGMNPFLELSAALGSAGRKLPLLPPVERGVYGVDAKLAAPRVKVGADVLPWRPVSGMFLLLEPEPIDAAPLLDVDGVIGAWSSNTLDVDPRLASAPVGQRLTHLFLDDDPVTSAARLAPVLRHRWRQAGAQPLFAAPFYPVIPHEWERHVP